MPDEELKTKLHRTLFALTCSGNLRDEDELRAHLLASVTVGPRGVWRRSRPRRTSQILEETCLTRLKQAAAWLAAVLARLARLPSKSGLNPAMSGQVGDAQDGTQPDGHVTRAAATPCMRQRGIETWHQHFCPADLSGQPASRVTYCLRLLRTPQQTCAPKMPS